MYRILAKEKLSDEVYRFTVHAPLIAAERNPGQFVIVQQDTEFGERIPLTIADADPREGTITLIFQAVGNATHRLAELGEGDSIENVLGPLGTPTHIERFGRVVCVGWGIGVAPLHPIAKGMAAAGNDVTVIMGARTRGLLILEDEMRSLSRDCIVCTDDGSYGRKGLVTAPLEELCAAADPPDLCVTIGPPVMMKFCSRVTARFGVPTIVSLNSIMVDGTGMCGGCRVTVGGETKFVCVDGPEFDGHAVDFDNLILRLGSYRDRENQDHERCHLELAVEAAERDRS